MRKIHSLSSASGIHPVTDPTISQDARARAAADEVSSHPHCDPCQCDICMGWEAAYQGALAVLRTPAGEAGEIALINHIAFILEQWNMKDPPAEHTGHAYADIAADIVRNAFTRLSATSIEALQQRVERLEGAINSVTLWMLHRFGPDSPEGKEAQVARAALAKRGG